MRSRYKPWAVEYLSTHTENEFFISEEESEKEKILSFIASKPTIIEIGPGKGQFITSLAKEYPEYNFLVIELDKSIAGVALKKIDESELKNVKLIAGDFYKLVNIIKNDTISGLFLNFSDPWPKKRHEKRRLTSPLFLVEYAKILKEGSCIYFKTDNDDFYSYSIDMFNEYGWEVVLHTIDYEEIDSFDALTEFEERYKAEGIKIKRLILKKTDSTKKEVIEKKEEE